MVIFSMWVGRVGDTKLLTDPFGQTHKCKLDFSSD